MKQLTREQRHEVYKEALHLFNKGFEDGICSAIGLIFVGKDYDYYRNNYDSNLFPEFIAKKPSNDDRLYWFGVGSKGKQARIEILTQCIEETKPL